MSRKLRPGSEPDWLNPANDRKAPYTDAELDVLAADFIAMNRDVAVWRNLIATVGEQEALAVAKQHLAARDPLSLISWKPVGSKHQLASPLVPAGSTASYQTGRYWPASP